MTENKDLIVIVGGGPAGLGAALAFDNNNYKNIVVLEGRENLIFDEENSYPVGVNVRGGNAIKNLFARKSTPPDIPSMGLKIDQWKILVGPGINVATFNSGLVTGTSRAGVTKLLYDEVQRRGIQVLFNYKAKSVDLKDKAVICDVNNEIKTFNPKCLVIADGYKSKCRDSLAEQSPNKSLKIDQWPWNDQFRVLISTPNPQTDLSPFTHYIYNSTYISKWVNGRWNASLAIKENSPKFLLATEATEENVDNLMKYVKKNSPIAYSLFTKDEYRAFFSRNVFSGAVTKVNKLFVEEWAVLLGDAAHSAFPGTHFKINNFNYFLQVIIYKHSKVLVKVLTAL